MTFQPAPQGPGFAPRCTGRWEGAVDQAPFFPGKIEPEPSMSQICYQPALSGFCRVTGADQPSSQFNRQGLSHNGVSKEDILVSHRLILILVASYYVSK